MHVVQSRLIAQHKDIGQITVPHLHQRTQLFVEENVEVAALAFVEADIQSGVRGKTHLAQRRQHAAVGTVVIGQQTAFAVEALDQIEEGFERLRLVHVRRHIAHLFIHLRQRRTAEAIPAHPQIEQQHDGVGVGHHVRGKCLARIAAGRKGGNDERQRCGNSLVLLAFPPGCLHAHGIFADRDADAELRAQFHAYCFDRIEQRGIFTVVAGGGHPVGGEFDIADLGNLRGGDVGDRLANRHATGGGCIDDGDGGAFTERESFAQMGVEAHQRHGHIGHRHLPRADHLVARGHAAHGAVADGNQEGLVRNAWQAQHTLHGFFQHDVAGVEFRQRNFFAPHFARHFRRFAEQHGERHIDRVVVEQRIVHHQTVVAHRMSEHGERAAFALAHRLEFRESLCRDRQHVTLLRLVAPDLHRRHAALFGRHTAQFETRALAAAVHQFRQRVGDAARADVVDGEDGIVVAQLPATVDDFLRAALHLGIAALHGIEIQILGIRAGIHAGGRTATQTDQHAGAAELDQHCAFRQVVFVGVGSRDAANAARQHDGLVVAAHFAVDAFLEGAEIARQIGAAEFVVERRAAERAIDHDLQRRRDTARFADSVGFPRLFKSRNA